MTMAFWAILGFFCFVMAVGSLALFFGSDYAQKRWNTDEYYKRTQEPCIVIERSYRTCSRAR